MAVDISNYEPEFETIADALLRGQVGFLLGAGMSSGSGIPGTIELAKRMLRFTLLGRAKTRDENQIVDEMAEKYPFEAIAEYCVKKAEYEDFATWLEEYGDFANAEPKEAHRSLRALRTLQRRQFPDVVFTTNFDNLIEKAFGENEALCVTSENLNDLRRAKIEKKLAVAHLHGSVKYGKSLILGEKKLATIEGTLFDLFRAYLAKDIFVLVGYSLSDTNMRNIFFDLQRIADTAGIRKNTYAISPAEGSLDVKASEVHVADKIWGLRNTTHLPFKADVFFQKLLDAVENSRNFKIRSEVAKLLKVDEQTLSATLESVAKPFPAIKPEDFLIYLYLTLNPS